MIFLVLLLRAPEPSCSKATQSSSLINKAPTVGALFIRLLFWRSFATAMFTTFRVCCLMLELRQITSEELIGVPWDVRVRDLLHLSPWNPGHISPSCFAGFCGMFVGFYGGV